MGTYDQGLYEVFKQLGLSDRQAKIAAQGHHGADYSEFTNSTPHTTTAGGAVAASYEELIRESQRIGAGLQQVQQTLNSIAAQRTQRSVSAMHNEHLREHTTPAQSQDVTLREVGSIADLEQVYLDLGMSASEAKIAAAGRA